MCTSRVFDTFWPDLCDIQLAGGGVIGPDRAGMTLIVDIDGDGAPWIWSDSSVLEALYRSPKISRLPSCFGGVSIRESEMHVCEPPNGPAVEASGPLGRITVDEVELDKRPLHASWTPLVSTIPYSLVIEMWPLHHSATQLVGDNHIKKCPRDSRTQLRHLRGLLMLVSRPFAELNIMN
jgi:hypothetical protein